MIKLKCKLIRDILESIHGTSFFISFITVIVKLASKRIIIEVINELAGSTVHRGGTENQR